MTGTERATAPATVSITCSEPSVPSTTPSPFAPRPSERYQYDDGRSTSRIVAVSVSISETRVVRSISASGSVL